ncbi:MAG TPA: hypothetical protein VF173_18255 [Thermoanaerobaculia bacterium]|nr:hypothetical protein [Thermoanaerobaculia bacterium]
MKRLAALTLVLGFCALLGPAKTSSAFTCSQICDGERQDCLADCHSFPYTGCANDCRNEWLACLAAC